MKPTELAVTLLTQNFLRPIPLTILSLFLVQNLAVLLKTELSVAFLFWESRVPLLHLLGTCSLIAFTIPTLVLAYHLFRRESQLQKQLTDLQQQLKQTQVERDRLQRLLSETMAMAGQVRVPVSLDKCIRSQLWNERVRWVEYDEPVVSSQSLPPLFSPSSLTTSSALATAPISTSVGSMNGFSARSGGAALDAAGVSVMGPETRLQQSFPSASQACAIVGETLPPKTSKPRAAVDGGVVLVADKLAASPQPAQRQESATNNNNNGKSRPASPQRQQSTVEQQQSETTATADSAADAMVLRGGQRILRKSSS